MKYEKYNLKSLAAEDRPREKFLEKGAKAMTNAELLAILIRSGSKDENALDLAQKLLREHNFSLRELMQTDVNNLTKMKGIGNAKAISIVAAFELGIRSNSICSSSVTFIKSSSDIYSIFWPVVGNSKYEEFWVLYLSRNLKVIKKEKVGQGGVHATAIDPKRILKTALDCLASSIALCHNHPSGNTEPSNMDIQLTKKIISGSELVDIQVIDHIIVTNDSYYSFADNGIL
ncbi:MAG: DNA repair protein RadC [Bacteroidales bacterium]|nr:DNA repair protein RadC [Bacteroidales bacterium]